MSFPDRFQPKFDTYETRIVCFEALDIADRQFRLIERAVPRADWVRWEHTYNWRFKEQALGQLLLQKFARQITGIKAIDLLLMVGHLQEIGVLYRMLDEIAEDTMFMFIGAITQQWTMHHDAYVRYFWSEDDKYRQPPARRKTIRSYVNQLSGGVHDHTNESAGRRIYYTKSLRG